MKSIKEYLCRIGKSKGFGIQSPWAYCFVKDVITETLPYYIYKDIEAKYVGKKEQKKQKLYFRVRNFIKRKELNVFDMNENSLEDINNFMMKHTDCVAIIVEGIFDSADTKDKWNRLKESELVGVTFDLYDFAICFQPSKLIKQHYKMNF